MLDFPPGAIRDTTMSAVEIESNTYETYLLGLCV